MVKRPRGRLPRLQEWLDVVSRHAASRSIKGISHELGISRNTVRATLRRKGQPQCARPAAPSKLDPHNDHLSDRLDGFPDLTAKANGPEIAAKAARGWLAEPGATTLD